MANFTRQLYRVTFSYTNPIKGEIYHEKIESYTIMEIQSMIDVGDDLPSPPESEKHTTYVAVLSAPPGDEIKTAVDMALKGALGVGYGVFYPSVTSVEALDSVFVEEEEKQGDEK